MKVLNNILLCSLFGLASFTAQAESGPTFAAGEQLFRTAGGYGCSACHGLFANGGGNVGGNIRGKTLSDINVSLASEPTMLLLADSLSSGDRENLAFYLQIMGEINLVEWTIEDKPTTSTFNIAANKPAQLVVLNKTFEAIELTIPDFISTQSIKLDPYQTKAVTWNPDQRVIKLNYNQSNLTINVK